MDDFKQLMVLGKGAFGTITLCYSKERKTRVVLKELLLCSESLEDLEKAKNEAYLLTLMHYPHIIGCYTYFVNCNVLTLVMEYATHGTLSDHLNQRKGQLLSLKDVLNLISQLLLAVYYIHSRNILHRDIKPENILLTGENGQLVKLGDFGISKLMGNGSTKTATIVGTLSYMAPEQCRGQAYGKYSDIWSLGCVFYSIFTLKRAFDAPTFGGVLKKILYGTIECPIDISMYDETLARIVIEMLNREPNLRPDVSTLMCHHLIAPFTFQLLVNFGLTFKT